MELKAVDLLILGAGWTSTFLIPLLDREEVSHIQTSTTGREGTVKFVYDPASDDEAPYKDLPYADTAVIVFPLKGKGQSKHLVDLYRRTHPDAKTNFVQLGSTGIWQIPDQPLWTTRHSVYAVDDARAVAEDELRSIGGCALNLAGLWGGERQPRDWVKRVAATKEQLKGKKSLHLIHGMDVSRAILALHRNFTPGERWMLTDTFVYDWYSLALGWGESKGEEGDAKGPHPDWIRELMVEEGIRGLPRSMEALGRCYDSRDFWSTFKIAPVRARAY